MNIRQLFVAGIVLFGATQLKANDYTITKLLAAEKIRVLTHQEKALLTVLQQKKRDRSKTKNKKTHRAAAFEKRTILKN